MDDILKKFEAKFHEVLKTEWGRVKKGEPWFIASKWIVGFVLIFILLFFVKDFV